MTRLNTPAKAQPCRFERFGLIHLDWFGRSRSEGNVFDMPDEVLAEKVNRITAKGVFWSALVGLVFVFPIIYVDVLFANASPWVHHGWVVAVLVVATAIEFYFLFYISLKAVHEVSELIHLRDLSHDSLRDSAFDVKNILARTALEIRDPEMRILGIDPFLRVSRKNLFVLGLLYKGKIIVTNVLLKFCLKLVVGPHILGVSILYVAIPVEMFWNGVVIRKVILEARLRLFGYVLANRIAETVEKEGVLAMLSPEAKKGCLRAIGNAVVMTQNHHPNMMILLLRFQNLLGIHEEDRYDDWPLFLETLNRVNPAERNFLLDVLTVAAAFDGKLSPIEKSHLKEAYLDDSELYMKRLTDLTSHLRHGRLHAAHALCKLDTVRG